MLKKIVVSIVLISNLIVANEVIPFEFYNQLTVIGDGEYQDRNGLKIISKDAEGTRSDIVEGSYWKYEYELEGVKRKAFIKEIEKSIKNREGTILFKGSDYVFFKLYDKKNLYKGRIVQYKNRYVVEMVREGAIVQDKPKENIILKNIKFDSGRATLQKGTEGEIERIFQFLVENSTYVVEIQGHTDSSGNNKANLTLSQKRANRVREALVQKGINKERIKAKGYGETLPVADNSTKEGRRKNRRVELKVLSQ